MTYGQDQGYWTLSELLRRRWSKGLISELLGEPDKTGPNPVHPTKAPVQFYDIKRVKKAEKRVAFKRAQLDRAARQGACKESCVS